MTSAIIMKQAGRKLVCKHCTYAWLARVEGYDPLICPSCHTWRWNTDAVFVSPRELKRIAAFIKVRDRKNGRPR